MSGNDVRGYVNPFVPGGLTEEGQRQGMVDEVYVEDRKGRKIEALIRSIRKGTTVQIAELFYLAPGIGRPQKRRRILGERVDAIEDKGGKIQELREPLRRSRALLRAYEQIATSGRARKHDRPGAPVKWVFTPAEREVVQGIWTSRKYKNDAERTLAVQQRTGKPIARAWLRRTFGSPHGR